MNTLPQAESTTTVATPLRARSTKNRIQRLKPLELVTLTGLIPFAQVCLGLSYLLQRVRRLSSSHRGRPIIYSDLTIVLTMIIQRLWQKSNEGIVQYLYDHPEVAVGLGYPFNPETGLVSIIDPAHYGRRKRRLGLFVFFVAFVLLVRHLAARGIIQGRSLIIDASKLPAWYSDDPDARWNDFLKINGYKIHMIIDHLSMLPIMFTVTPANVHDSMPVVLLLLAVKVFYNFAVQVVRADAAYFDRKCIGAIIGLFGAWPCVDYNLRRKGKKFLASLEFLAWWNHQREKRADIERFFGIIKRWYGLKHFYVQGLPNVMRHALLTCIAMLLTAQAAHAIGRPDLGRSPKRLLADL